MNFFTFLKSKKIQKTLTELTIAAVASFSASQVLAQEWQGSINGILGQVQLKESEWGDQKSQGAIGVMGNFGRTNWPVDIAVDLIGSGDEDKSAALKNELYTAAMHLGIRKTFQFESNSIKPYLGGGLALINVEFKQTQHPSGVTTSEEDSGSGYWVGAGSFIELNGHLQLGFDVRYSNAEVKIGNKNRKAGGVQSFISLGYHW